MVRRVTLPPPPPKGRKRTPLEIRADALRATVAEFGPKRFSFRLGRDCVQMVCYHLRQLNRPVSIASAGKYRDAPGAKKALERLGFATVGEAMDAHFERIPYARALIGDIVQIDTGEGEFSSIGGLGIYMGDGAVYGYHEDAERPVSVLLLEPPLAVWPPL